MNSIYSFHKNHITISSGRSFDEIDYINQEVCIIHDDIAKANQIKVGDVVQFRINNEYGFLNSTPKGRFFYDSPDWSMGFKQPREENYKPEVLNKRKISNKQDLTYGFSNKGGEDYIDPSTIFIPYNTRESLFTKIGYEDDKIICDQFISLALRTGSEKEFYEYLNKNGLDKDRFQIMIDDSNFRILRSY